MKNQNNKTKVISCRPHTPTSSEKNYHLLSGIFEFLALEWHGHTKGLLVSKRTLNHLAKLAVKPNSQFR